VAAALVAKILDPVNGAERTFADLNVYIVVGVVQLTSIVGTDVGVGVGVGESVNVTGVLAGIVAVGVNLLFGVFVACPLFACVDVCGPQPAIINAASMSKSARPKRGVNCDLFRINISHFRKMLFHSTVYKDCIYT
jgi:hypothetical protein